MIPMKQNQNYETLKKINNLSAKEKEELANKANIRNKDQLFTAVKMLAEKSEELWKNFGWFLIDFRRKNNNSELLDEYLKVKQIYEQREKDLFNNLNDWKNNSWEKAWNKNRYTLNENERQNQLQWVLGLIQEHKNEIEWLGNRQAFGEYIEAYNALDTFYNKNSNKAKRLDKYNELTNKLNSLYESFEDDFKGNESLLKKESDLYTHIEHVDDILLLMTKLLWEIPNPSQREW